MEVERKGDKVVVVKTMSGGVNVSEIIWDSRVGTSELILTGDRANVLDIRIVVGDGDGTGGDVSSGV